MPGIDPSNDHPAMENKAINVVQCLEAQIDGLRGAVIDELCLLRRDVDTLSSGGWKVQVGLYQKNKIIDDIEVAVIRQQIAARLSLNATPQQNGCLSLDGVSDNGGTIRHDSPMKASPAAR
jgi:hypothetical protein